MELLSKFIKKIEAEISETESEIASKERRISRLRAKLKNPEKAFNLESGASSRRFRSVSGEKVEHKSKNFKNQKKEIVLPLTRDIAEEPKKEEEKSSWSFY